jgi:iron complex transport system substrate-binding protein
MLFALGLGDEVVAVTHECDHPGPARSLPQLTRTVVPEGLGASEIDAEVKRVVGEGRPLYELDEERLAAAAPNLIVAQAVCDVCAVSYEEVEEVARRLPGRPRVLSLDPATLEEVLDDIGRLGRSTGAARAAAELRAELEGRLMAVEAAVTGAPRRPTLALEWLDPPFVGGHWIPQMIEAAGGEDVAGRGGEKSFETIWDELLRLDPEVVVAMPCGLYVEEALAEAEQHRDRLERLGARGVFAVDAASSFSRPGPRLVDGVELLAHLLHPDRAGAPGGVGFRELGGLASRVA